MNKDKIALIKNVDTIMKFCRLYLNNRKDMPVPPTQIALMIYVAQYEGDCTPVTVAEFFNVKKPIVSKNVKALEALDYIRKVPSVTDKRSYNLKLTASGEALIEDNFYAFSHVMSSIQEELGEAKFQQFVSLVDEVNELLIKHQK